MLTVVSGVRALGDEQAGDVSAWFKMVEQPMPSSVASSFKDKLAES